MDQLSRLLGEYFRHPLYVLYGLPAALIPLLIYLFFRWRTRRIKWGAVEFLQRARARLKTRLQLQQIIMLIVRTLLVIMLACALARPLIKRGVLLGERNAVSVIVLDVSYSMGARGIDGKPLIEAAKEKAITIVQAMTEGDKVGLMTMGGKTEIVLKPDADRQKAISEIRKIELGDGLADVAAGIKTATETLIEKGTGTRMAYIITDMQAVSWKPSGSLAKMEEELKKLSAAGKPVVIDVNDRANDTKTAAANCSVRSLGAGDSLIAQGMQATLTAELVNYGNTPREVTVEWEVAGIHRESPKEVTIPARMEPLKVDWKYVFAKAGNYRVVARIKDKGMPVGVPADDECFLAMSVRDAVDVLVVQGGQMDRDMFEREADFLLLALAPIEGGADKRVSLVRHRTMPESEMPTARLSEYDVVVLANIRMITTDMAARLENFVRQGGGLLVFLGDNIEAGAYNLQLHKGGNGLLPAEILNDTGPRRPGSPEGGPATVGFEPLEHPIMASMRSGDYGRPGDVAVRSYRNARPGGKLVCRYTDGAPAIIEKRFGRGDVLLVTTACDRDWSDWPVQPLYAPFVQDAIRYLVRKDRLNVIVGEKWTRPLLPDELGFPITVTAPDSKEYAIRPESREDGAMANYEGTARRGFYRVRIGDNEKIIFAANPDPAEGTPGLATDTELGRLYPKFQHTYFDASQDLARGVRDLMAGNELSKPFLVAALILAFLEVILSYLFKRARST
ncbi:MAG: hypothetical protein C0404_04475 [Verrucomicrobia bacterium]|nr:hypothetical protein [Verrucomicrobiota bacterium]